MMFPRSNVRAVLATAAFCLVGCVKTHDDVTVKADGSGSYTETTVMDVSAMTEMGEAMKGFGAGFGGGGGFGQGPGFGGGAGMNGGDKPPEPTAPPEGGVKPPESGAKPPDMPKPSDDPIERLKARQKDIPGLDVTKMTTDTKDGKANILVEATFKTIEAYARGSSIEMGASLLKNDDGSYTLKFEGKFGMGKGGRPDGAPRGAPGMEGAPGGTDGGAMDGAPPGMDGTDAPPGGGPGGGMGGMGGMGAMMMPMLEKYLAGLEYSRTLKLPGTIVETNGTKSEDGSTVSWKLTFDDIKSGKAEPQTVTFKGEGLDLKPFTVKRSARRSMMGGPGGGLPRPLKDAPPGTPGTPPGGAPPGSGDK